MTHHVSIVYHSGYGHTAKVATAIAQGVTDTGATAHLLAIDAEGNLPESAWETLDQSHAIVFGTPTYMGGVSWQFKKFADTTSRRWAQQGWHNKLAAGFTNSGSLSGDKLSTLNYLFILAMQHGMIWVGQDSKAPTPKGTDVATAQDINRIGSYSGLMTQSNNESAEIAPPAGDLQTATLFGARIAATCKRIA